MSRMNVWAVIVAALAAFMASAVWYAAFGKALANVSVAFAEQKRATWKMLVVVAQSLVLASVVSYLIGRIGAVGWMDSIGIGVLL